MKRLAIITSHPIQYNAPLFSLLHHRQAINIKVFYTWGEAVLEKKYDPGFNSTIEWDLPLLSGYNFQFVKNTSTTPGSHHFNGIINPTLIGDIKTFEADALLVFGWNFNSHFKALRYFHKRIPVFFRGDSTILNNHTWYKMLARKIFLKYVYKHIDFALYVGTENEKYFKEYGVKDNQLIFSGHAIDMDRFSTSNPDVIEKALKLKQSITGSNKSIVFLFAGKLEYVKNVTLLIKSFNSLKEENIHLVVAGSGLLKEDLKLMAAQNINIHFLPFQNQSEMPTIYHLADVFILPSKSETWGLSINEAMACGKAILVSDKCGCAIDLVKDNINGFIFANDNNLDLLQKMKNLVFDMQKLQTMGERSKEIIKEYSYENICLALENSLSTIKTAN